MIPDFKYVVFRYIRYSIKRGIITQGGDMGQGMKLDETKRYYTKQYSLKAAIKSKACSKNKVQSGEAVLRKGC